MMQTAAHFRPESYEQGTSREWLVTNGLGGYASATAIGCNTRAYHGLLVAALTPPGNRRLLLSSLDEEINGQKLANHKYPGVVHPQGFRYLQEFWIDPIPRFCYQVGKTSVEKTSYMSQEMKNIKIKPRTGFEPATSSLPRTRYTGLSYRGAKSPLC